MDKINVFEFVLSKLIFWYNNSCGITSNREFNENNDFSKLKVMKLYFFVISADSTLIEQSNFHALPFGHVESDIYNSLSLLTRFQIDERATIIKDDYIEDLHNSFNIDANLVDRINKAINCLVLSNKDLINYSAFDLVELSHLWHSWKSTIHNAKLQGKYSGFIDVNLIKSEPKIYALP